MKFFLIVSCLLSAFLSASLNATEMGQTNKAGALNEGQIFNSKAIPSPLEPWVDWVLRDEMDYGCPFENKKPSRECIFPSKLKINADKTGVKFEYSIYVVKKRLVPILGDKSNWPSWVSSFGRKVPVILQNESPYVLLDRGSHLLSGFIAWQVVPDSLRIPESVGVIDLSVNGKAISDPVVDDSGLRMHARFSQLAPEKELEKSTDNGALADGKVEIKVVRMLEDGVPLTLETRIKLNVNNFQKEMNFGPALPSGFVPSEFQSPLPLRLDSKNKLQILVKPGEWDIVLKARHNGPLTNLTLLEIKDKSAWPEEEVWVFQPNPNIRAVAIEGVTTIDPSLSEIPLEWRRGVTAFKMSNGVTLSIRETKRGISTVSQESLALNRDVWVDFSGNAFSFRDILSGRVAEDWRFNATERSDLGRVQVNNIDTLITRRSDRELPGIDVRSNNVHILSEGRISEKAGFFLGLIPSTIPLATWDRTFQSINMNLKLPPGWDVFAVLGADRVSQSWLQNWSLWNVFVLLVMTLAVFRLIGKGAAILGFIALLLILPSQQINGGLWLNLLIAVTLVSYLPSGKLNRFFVIYRNLSAMLLGGFLLVFSVGQLREAVHPVLSKKSLEFLPQPMESAALMSSVPLSSVNAAESAGEPGGLGPGSGTNSLNAPPKRISQNAKNREIESKRAEEKSEEENSVEQIASEQYIPEEEQADVHEELEYNAPEETASLVLTEDSKGNSEPLDETGYLGAGKSDMEMQSQVDTSAIQTGLGTPSWEWKNIAMEWQGPLNGKQTLTIWLTPPFMMRIGNILRVLMSLAFFALLLIAKRNFRFDDFFHYLFKIFKEFKLIKSVGLVIIASFIFSSQKSVYAQNFPTPAVLDELKQSLLKPPSCLPNCASINKAQFEFSGNRMRMSLEIHVQNEIVMPVFAAGERWRPSSVSVDGSSALGLVYDRGQILKVWLKTGVHNVVVQGTLPEVEAFPITFASEPLLVSSQGNGWNLEGVRDGKMTGASLLLRRRQSQASDTQNELKTAGRIQNVTVLQPLLRVERHIFLDKTWRVISKVSFLTQQGAAVTARIPLLQGELVSTSTIRSENGFLVVTLDKGSGSVTWASLLDKTESLRLKSTEPNLWLETWKVTAGPLWNFTWEGIPPVQTSFNGQYSPTWQPWPGEEVLLKMSSPEAVKGQTLSALGATLEVRPGLRAVESSLTLIMKSSKGVDHPIGLPSGIKILSAKVYDGRVDSALSLNPLLGREIPVRLQDEKFILPITPGEQTFVLNWSSEDSSKILEASPKIDLGLPLVNLSMNITQPKGRWIAFLGGPLLGPVVELWGLLLTMVLLALLLSRFVPSPLGFVQWLLLGIGIIPVDCWSFIAIAILFIILAFKDRFHQSSWWRYNLRQVILFSWVIVAVLVLVHVLKSGFLGSPDMRIAGNGSTTEILRWYADRIYEADGWPRAWVISFPDFVYRLAMLVWALWLASSIVNWSKWFWGRLTLGTLWMSKSNLHSPSKPE